MFDKFVVQNKVSLWLIFVVLIISASMMHPSFATLIALSVEACVLVALRHCAHVEAHYRVTTLVKIEE